MSDFPKISVVVVNYNLARYLAEALESIVSQQYPALELIVVDGGSTDGSVEVIQRFASHIHWWVSEADGGQYDAVQKGFARSSGEIMYWLNSDDMLQRKSLFTVARVFQQFPEVRWLTGLASEYHPDGMGAQSITLPWSRWSRHRYRMYDFMFIQQESTFWRRSLWEEAGGRLTVDLRLAGDMELWARFFRHAQLYTVQSVLGGFRYRREGQRSRDQRDRYIRECVGIVQRERGLLPWYKRLGYSLARPAVLGMGLFFFFDVPFLRAPYEWLMGMPPVIGFDTTKLDFVMDRRQVNHPPVYLFGSVGTLEWLRRKR